MPECMRVLLGCALSNRHKARIYATHRTCLYLGKLFAGHGGVQGGGLKGVLASTQVEVEVEDDTMVVVDVDDVIDDVEVVEEVKVVDLHAHSTQHTAHTAHRVRINIHTAAVAVHYLA